MNDLTREFSSKRVLVIGDLVLDEYIVGRPARIAREAPVLILQKTEERHCPGGAANLAANLAALGAQVTALGVVGQDRSGVRLIASLKEWEIDTFFIVPGYGPTATKTRLVAGGDQEREQIVLRVDTLQQPLAQRDIDELRNQTTTALQEQTWDAVMVSDYENGVLHPSVVAEIMTLSDAPVFVDSHGELTRFRGAFAMTPNQPEFDAQFAALDSGYEDFAFAAQWLRRDLDVQHLLVTQGSQGLTLFNREGHDHFEAVTQDSFQVADPNGAGDTVAAVFALAMVSGFSPYTAAQMANVAGGEVVRTMGPATISRRELEYALATAGVVAA